MSKLGDIITKLKATSSTKEKQSILEAHSIDKDLIELFHATLNPMFNFYLGGDKISTDASLYGSNDSELTAETIRDMVDVLNGRKLTGHAARDYVQNMVDGLVTEDKELVVKILKRDLDCKVSVGLVDRVWKGLIPNYPCLLASKMDEKAIARVKTWSNYFVQLKADGGRCNARVDTDGSVSWFSRNGNALTMHGVLDKALQPFAGYVVDGELLYKPNNDIANRQTGNGLFNKAVRGTISLEEAEGFLFVIWDMIPIDKFDAGYDETAYEDRFSRLESIMRSSISDRLELIEGFRTSDLDMVMDYFRKNVAKGLEGAIIKKASLPWGDIRSEDMIKLKEIKTCELRCIGFEPHRKDPNKIGSLLFSTDDGLLETNAGSGLTDEDRAKDPSEFIGKVFELEYNGVIKAKGSKKPSLFLPVIVKIRLDKLTTDNFKDL